MATEDSSKGERFYLTCMRRMLTYYGNMSSRHVPVIRECPCCKVKEKTTLHFIVQCQYAANCLGMSSVAVHGVQANSFVGWCEMMRSRVDKKVLGEVAVTCWAIWRARNKLVWKEKALMLNEVVSTTKVYLKKWKITHNREKFLPLPSNLLKDGAVKWERTSHNQLKINVDVALFGDKDQYGVGMVAPDHAGQFVEARTWSLREGSVAPELAEVMGIREVLS